VQSVTSARRSLSDDIDARTHRYLIMMGIRTACFLAAVLLPGLPVWARGLLIAGALVLPYIAVVDANSGREPPPSAAVPPVPPDRPALGTDTGTPPDR
jgi:hypothetical protein